MSPRSLALAAARGLPIAEIGTVGGDRLLIELGGRGAIGDHEGRGSPVSDALDVSLADLRHAWDHGLERALGEDTGHRAPRAGRRAA